MGTLTETPVWEAGVRHFEANAVLTGGPDCPDNLPLSDLANRTAWLKQQVEAAQGGLAGHEAAADPHPQYATDADLATHAAAADPHPVYLTSAEGDAKIAAAVAALVNGSPAALDTLAELATALGNDQNFATTITNALATKLTQAQGDARYALLTALAGYALKGANSDITALNAVVSGSVFRKNIAINGGFDVWQRGTAFAGITNVPVYTADRWFGYRNAVIAGMSVSRQAATGSAQYALRAQRDAGNTSTACIGIGTCFESSISKKFAGKQVTVSFSAKAGANYSAAGSILPVIMYTGTGTDQSSTSMTAGTWTGNAGTSQNVVISPVQGRYSATFNVPAGTTQVGFAFAPQMVGVAGANDWYELEDVQIELSPVATDFEVLPVQQTLALCQRYYETGTASWMANTLTGTTNSSTFAYYMCQVGFKAEKRASPTMTNTAPAANPYVIAVQASGDTKSAFFTNSGSYGSGVPQGNNAFSVTWTANSEL